MRFILLGIVLAFPLLDLYVTVRFAHWSGIPLWLWLAAGLLSGLTLLRNERIAFRANTVAALHGDQPLLRGLVDSGRKVLAGMLLVFPGVVSDVIALLLLMLPINHRRFRPVTITRSDHAIDGEYRRMD